MATYCPENGRKKPGTGSSSAASEVAALSEYVKYTAADGSAEMYGEDGIMSRLQDFSGWRSSWVLAVSGRFLGNGRDQLALYDRGRF